jgi:hypothetical protein
VEASVGIPLLPGETVLSTDIIRRQRELLCRLAMVRIVAVDSGGFVSRPDANCVKPYGIKLAMDAANIAEVV